MLRKTLTILSFIGLLLSVAAWGVSHFYSLNYVSGSRSVGLGMNCVIFGGGLPQGWSSGIHQGWQRWRWHKRDRRYPHFAMPQHQKPLAGIWFQMLPLWIPTLLCSALFLCCRPLYFHRLRKRKKLGLCVKCGYDLRASKDRCSECGDEFGLAIGE